MHVTINMMFNFDYHVLVLYDVNLATCVPSFSLTL